jgi:hypothetical protein
MDNGQWTIELLFGWVAICVFWGAAVLAFGVLELAFFVLLLLAILRGLCALGTLLWRGALAMLVWQMCGLALPCLHGEHVAWPIGQTCCPADTICIAFPQNHATKKPPHKNCGAVRIETKGGGKF